MFREGFRGSRQERGYWYQVDYLLTNIGKTAESIGLLPTDLVHIGGISIFFRGLEVFGASAVNNSRGTEDLDIVSWRPGSFDQLAAEMKARGIIEDIQKRPAPGLKDKFSYDITLPTGNNVGVNNVVPIDLYTGHNSIRFNDRVMTPDAIIIDPPDVLGSLQRERGLVVVPSVRDTLAVKLDIVDSSGVGLREKDEIDILWMLGIISRSGLSFEPILRSIIDNANRLWGFDRSLLRLGALENLFSEAEKKTVINRVSKELARDALRTVRDMKKRFVDAVG